MSELPIRRGLPREPGGEPWPPAGTVIAPAHMHDGDAPTQPTAPNGGVESAGSGPGGIVQVDAVQAEVEQVSAARAGGEQAEVANSAGAEVAVEKIATTTSAEANGPLGSAPVLRRGLPREPGGEPWPVVAGASPQVAAATAGSGATQTGPTTASVAIAYPAAPMPNESTSDGTSASETTSVKTAIGAARSGAVAGGAVRRGLPREVGGEAWPTDSVIASSAGAVPGTGAATGDAIADAGAVPPGAGSVDTSRSAARPATGSGFAGAADAAAANDSPTATETTGAADGIAANTATNTVANTATQAGPAVTTPGSATPAGTTSTGTTSSGTAPASTVQRSGMSVPASKGAGATGAGDAVGHQKAKPAAKLYRGKALAEWARLGALSVGGLIVVALVAVFGVRWWLGTEAMQDFLATYPGQYELPANAPEGFPAWLRWSHFFNVFLMVLIIRSGWQIRTEKKPQAYWTPKWNKKRKISLTMWFHQALDLLWVINGAVFVVLLFATGQWMRIVPTSWEVFPNALSAGLQYVSLDWPVEDGWVNYNSLQQLTYFLTVFVAAPLAVVTGVRMSGLWPNKPALNKAYPIEAARAVHFPVMIYFVVFIVTHVFLVLSTGALRNLNHMYTGTSEVSWVGFWLFVLSLGVIVGGVFAARALVIAPIASLFGRVGR